VKKEDLYSWIKIVGMISFIPIILAAGPITAFFVGDYLVKTFRLGSHILFIAITIGTIASIFEVVRIVKLVVKIEKKSQHE